MARDPELGFVGDVTEINPEVILGLIDDEFIPVIATIGSDVAGQAYNINADTVAGAIAESLGAEKLVYLTDIEGLRRDVADPASLIRQTTADELDSLIADGTIAGGMIPKVASCTQAVRNGVRRAHILDGRIEHVLLLEVFTDAGIGTMVGGAPDGNGDAHDEHHATAHDFDHDALDHCPFMPVFGAPSIMFERGRGTELWDTNGKRYLDFLAGIAVVSLGHANPVVADAIADQARRLLHVSNFFTNPVAAEAAMAVNELLFDATGRQGQIFFTNSGAEVQRVRDQAGPQARRTRPPHGGQRPRQLPRAHARRRWRRPASRPSTNRSSRCRRGSVTWRGATSTRCGPPSTDRWRRC